MRLGRRPLRADYPQCRVVHLDAPPRVAAFPERMNTGSVGRHLRRQRPMATRRRGDRGDSEHQNHEYGPESQGRSAGRKSMCHGHPHRGRESRGPQPREPGGLGRWVGLRALNRAASRQQDPATPPPIDGARDASGPSLVAVDPTSVLRPIPGGERWRRGNAGTATDASVSGTPADAAAQWPFRQSLPKLCSMIWRSARSVRPSKLKSYQVD